MKTDFEKICDIEMLSERSGSFDQLFRMMVYSNRVHKNIDTFCDVMGINRSTYYHWLSGKRHPNKENLLKIYEFFGMGNLNFQPVAYLANRE